MVLPLVVTAAARLTIAGAAKLALFAGVVKTIAGGGLETTV